ncbi:helix-turn-helix domain-containing protein [Embleya hyalina]|uniref:SARP family transcriptional regulator n=1 Tax=Embleya hyalina TaxID=516124 RepID=A0A401Z2H8_9ACTN|nr:helix-turn-helix transcriptional regulator [Embleya hyalina]GCE01001.1 SARP family transcriptional regulator [Embleya hyalina]
MTDELSALLRRLRTQSGLTQEQTAERSGVSVRTIRRLETGTSSDHRLKTLHLLADALNVGPEDRRLLETTLARTRTASDPPPPEPAPGTPERIARAPEPIDAAPASPVAAPSAPGRGGPPVDGVLAAAVAELAREVGRRLRREEEHRRVHDPFPLPVRWHRAPAHLTDHAENVQRLSPGATSPAMDLSGDLRSVAEIYRRIPSERLVVLGRAGSGKSILAIRFVLDCLKSPTPHDRVPVILGLGSWDPTAVALRDWLIDRLVRDHPHLNRRAPGGATLATALVDADLVLPVLDGFDEIAEGLRQAALEALNDTSRPLVLTSRADEYAEAVEAIRAPLLWSAGIELTDLTRDDLDAYLPRTARPIARDGRTSAVWELVLAHLRDHGKTAASVNLAAVLSTPLMVALARTMYSESPDRDPAELLDDTRFPTEHAIEEHLLAGFVPTVYRRRVPERAAAGRRRRERNWDPEHAERWLGYLAHHTVRLDRDRQDLAWWQIGESVRRSTRVMIVVVLGTLCAGVAECVVDLLVYDKAFDRIVVKATLAGPIAGIAGGTVYTILIGFGGGVFEPARVRPRLPGTGGRLGGRPLRTFIASFGLVLLGGFVLGAGSAWVPALENRLYHGRRLTDGAVIDSTLTHMLVLGLIFGFGGGLVFGLLAILEAPLDITSASAPVSLLATNRATVTRQILVLAPTITLAIALGGRGITDLLRPSLGPLEWGLPDGLAVGAVSGLAGSISYALLFTAWGQWVIFSRFWLPLTGKLPWDTAAFLDDAYRRGVLRQAGAVHQFRHIRLQHHLARTHRQQQTRYTPARLELET